MGLESKISKTAKFTATGLIGTAACMTACYGLGELLENTYVDTGIQHLFNFFNVRYEDLGTLGGFIGFGTGLKMTALLEFYNTYPKIKNLYNKTKDFLKKTYARIEEKEKGLEKKIKEKANNSKLKTLGKYFVCASIGLGLGKIVGEGFEHISYTNQAITYLFNTFADVHFKELGDLITLLGMIWGFRFKPQLELLHEYLTSKK